MSVKRYPVSNGLLIVRGKEAYDTFNLQNVMVVLATDYDADLDRLTSDKARLASELAAEQESNTFLNNLHAINAERIRALEAALRKIGYEPIGHAEATEREVLQAIVDIARSALETFDEPTMFKPLKDGLCVHCGRDARNHDFGGPCRPGSAMQDLTASDRAVKP